MTQAAPQKIKRRQKQTSRDVLAHLFLAAWVCVLVQGALRKWVFPNAPILYLIQDVPLLMAYFYAVWKKLLWTGPVAWTLTVLSILLGIETMLQIIFGDLSLRTAVIGLHHYIFYLPILFLAPVAFNFKHRSEFIRWNLLITIPEAMIATLQSRSPKAAWINRTSAGDDSGFGLSGETVRATGTFNFTLFYSVWCGVAVALVVGEWLLPPERRAFKSRLLLLVCTLSAVLATMVSGSRSAIMVAALGFVGGFAAVIFTRNIRLIVRFATILVLVPVIALIGSLITPASFNAVKDRFSGEANQQSIVERVNHLILGFTYAAQFSVLGKGVGYGIPAANPKAAAAGLLLSENENIRLIQEMGTFVGTGLVVLRYASGVLVLLLAFRCMKLPRGHRFPHALPLAFSAVPTILLGELIRSAPLLATQTYFCIALMLSAVLFRREPPGAPIQQSQTR